MRSFTVFALTALAAMALAQTPSIPASSPLDLKLGLSQGDLFGAYAGLAYRLPNSPLRLDLDAYSAFQEFGDRSAGVEATVNYIYALPTKGFRGTYVGVGVGYIRGRERGDDFDSVGTKFIVGAAIPNSRFGLEGALLWAQHSIGQIHTVGTVSLVYRL